MISQILKDFIKREQLPESYEKTILTWFVPLAETLKNRCLVGMKPLIVGIQGAQGSGKSTLAALLVCILKEEQGLKTIHLSLDDFYLTRAQRLSLAREVHPLLETRGVPGTHDLALAAQTLDALCAKDGCGTVAVPQFDKARDDRLPIEQWPLVNPPFDIIFLEGWCLAAPPENDEALVQTINPLESNEDPLGVWRRYVNDLLKTDYADFFRRLNLLIVLQAPSFEAVYDWRVLQEKKLREKIDLKNHRLMNAAELKRFMQHFERVCRNCLSSLPEKANILFKLNADHEVIERIPNEGFSELDSVGGTFLQ